MIFLTSREKFDGVVNLELNEIRFHKFSLCISDFNAVIVTSKNSIFALEYNQISPNQDVEIYSIGANTSKIAKRYGFDKIYTAKNSHGNDFASEIAPLLAGKKTLFLKAKQTASNVYEILLKNRINLTQIVAYESVAKSVSLSEKPPKNSILIFTSPSNVRNFISNFGWDSSYKCVSIGKTTAKALENLTDLVISQNQNLSDCVKLAKALV